MKNIKENTARVEALKKISGAKWVGNTTHENIEMCLTAINLDSPNSGWYKPTPIRIKGLTGIYMINEDGSLFCESRIIKQAESKYLIEYLTTEGWNLFEDLYDKFLE